MIENGEPEMRTTVRVIPVSRYEWTCPYCGTDQPLRNPRWLMIRRALCLECGKTSEIRLPEAR